MTEEQNPLVKAYFAIEDKYYGLMDFLEDNLRLPVYEYFVEPIESRGVPSFPIFVILLLALFGGLFYLLQPSSFGLTVSVTSASDGSLIDGAQVLLIDSAGGTQSAITLEGSVLFTGLSSSQLPMSIKVSKQGFVDGGANVSSPVEKIEVALQKLTAAKPTVTPTATPPGSRFGVITVRLFDENGLPVSDPAQVIFYDVATTIPLDQATSSNAVASSKELPFGSVVQIHVQASGFEPYDHPSITVDSASMQIDVNLQKPFYVTNSVCGNEILEDGEECDSSLEACGPEAIGCGATACACMYPTEEGECGNGIKEYGEECDGTPTIPTSVCLSDCTQAPGNLTVTVFVVDGNNSPIFADSIKIFKKDETTEYKSAANASNYTFALPTSTTFVATASKTGFDPGTSIDFSTGENVTILLNAVNNDTSGKVLVLVKDAAGAVVSDAAVGLNKLPLDDYVDFYVGTNESGIAVFPGISFGDYYAFSIYSDKFGEAYFTLNSSEQSVSIIISGGNADITFIAVNATTNETLPDSTNPLFELFSQEGGFATGTKVSECTGQGCTAYGLEQWNSYDIKASASGFEDFNGNITLNGSVEGNYSVGVNIPMVAGTPSPTVTPPAQAKCSDGTPVGWCSNASVGSKCVDKSNPHLLPSCGATSLGLCECATGNLCTADGTCRPKGPCSPGNYSCDGKCIPEWKKCLPETITIDCNPGTLKLKISGGQITLKADELFPYDAVQINVDTSKCTPGYHFDFATSLPDPCFKFDDGDAIFYYDGGDDACKQLRPRSTLWKVGFSGQIGYDLYIPVRLYAANELIPYVVDPVVSCEGESENRAYFSYIVDSGANANAVYRDASFDVEGGLLTLLIRGRPSSDLPILPKPPGPMPECFYDYDYDGRVSLEDADVITNNAGKFATWNNCSVKNKYVSCQLLDGSQEGRINAKDRLGIAAHLGASCNKGCFFNYNEDNNVDNADALLLSNYYGKLAGQTCGKDKFGQNRPCSDYDGNKDDVIDFLDSYGIQANDGKVCSDDFDEATEIGPCDIVFGDGCQQSASDYAYCLWTNGQNNCLQKYLFLFNASLIQLDWQQDCSEVNMSKVQCLPPFEAFDWIGGPVIDYGFLYKESVRCASSWCPVDKTDPKFFSLECGGNGMCSWVERWQQRLSAYTKYLANQTALQRGNGKPLSLLNDNDKLNKGLTFSWAIPMQVPPGPPHDPEITSLFYAENITGDEEVPPIFTGGENQISIPSMNWTVENRSSDAAVYKLSVSCSSWLANKGVCDWKYDASIITDAKQIDASNPASPTPLPKLKGLCGLE